LTRFLAELTARLGPWQPQAHTNKKLVRLRRSALRFLATGSKVAYDNNVYFPGDRPQVILNYVFALENLLSGGDNNQIDLSRRTAQRAAALVGTDDASRRRIFEQVHGAYGGAVQLRMVQTPTTRNSQPLLRTCGPFSDER
jgi:hypothetical protein